MLIKVHAKCFGLAWGGQREIFSTPRGGQNYFQELIDEILHKGNPKGFSFHRVTLQDALEEASLVSHPDEAGGERSAPAERAAGDHD